MSDHPHRGRQLRLLIATIRALCAEWLRAEELGARLGVSKRTAYRILASLLDAGLPLDRIEEQDVGERLYARYRLDPDWWRTATPQRGRESAREETGL